MPMYAILKLFQVEERGDTNVMTIRKLLLSSVQPGSQPENACGCGEDILVMNQHWGNMISLSHFEIHWNEHGNI